MEALVEGQAANFAAVAAAHRFLVSALPLTRQKSLEALRTCAAELRSMTLLPTDLDDLLLRCLEAVEGDRRCDGAQLIACYLADADGASPIDRFERCVARLLDCIERRNANASKMVALIDRRYVDSKLRLRGIARELDCRLDILARQFRNGTGFTFAQYLRRKRLDAAAELLEGSATIKEVWTRIGYNHPSNFDHDFKRQFGCSPGEYRERCLTARNQNQARAAAGTPKTVSHQKILIVDDDATAAEITAISLRLDGFDVFVALNGQDGLRLAAAFEPDVILLDYRLPDIDGLACLRALRDSAVDCKSRVVLFTADVNIDVAEVQLQSLNASIAWKPCDVCELQKLLA